MGSSSACPAATERSRSPAWHLGQWRLLHESARAAVFDVATESRRAQISMAHHPQLLERQRVILKLFAMDAEKCRPTQ